ncbi:hypothetical protein [Microbacterium azadirachtae]|uniref:hypothetical protein n=1 Tax=Microbacterium azadirachtae TaxID=582680 RepID=UPI0008846F4D|nr:hypothetical protein [Microbacterium azadirachtae]SDL30306.1 hypothetical protein SAMN04488593_0629 [Microbacterium azadirachtae]SEF60425.1 hypothetical protein SAMN04488594_0619 [Microbacterium azadirachtae]SEF61041.1 hypothetical protein SAMN04488592_0628 [Microbacterium azadirachtae]
MNTEPTLRTDPERRVLYDLGRKKDQLRATREELTAARELIDELRRELLHLHLSRVLLRMEDFDHFIGLENVIDARGRIAWRQVDARVRQLLARRPELGRGHDVAEAC